MHLNVYSTNVHVIIVHVVIVVDKNYCISVYPYLRVTIGCKKCNINLLFTLAPLNIFSSHNGKNT